MEERDLHGVDAELERLVEGPAMGPVPVSAVADERSGELKSPLTQLADTTVSDTLLSGCRRSNWVLNPEMVLSFGGKEDAHGTEEFRSLRSRLYRVRKEQHLKSILISSALPKEGRSFVAANLAQVLALQPDCRVLLIDADLRNPRLHVAFGTSAKPGLSEYLLQEVDEFAIMQRGQAEGLFLIPSGRLVSGPTEVVANGRLKSLIDQIESLFDWIIVDSPAAVPVSDACLLANSCDGVLLVVRSHSTPFDIVRKARGRFREESLVGVVLNTIETKAPPRSQRY
jgi:capsular exopolysaccharide synthesis family protein